nr:hypothetical protein [Tanacetum cinerariifolium]
MALNNAQTKTNSLAFRSMLEKHQLTGPNFNEWFRALKPAVRTEKLWVLFEIALPHARTAGADAQALADWVVLFYRHNEVACKAKEKGKGKGPQKSYPTKPKKPQPYKKEHPAKDGQCHHYKEEGHWKRICPVYLAELMKKKKKNEGYPKETMGYYFYYPHENKIVVERYANFLEKDFILQKESVRIIELKDEEILPTENTSEHPIEEESLSLIISQEEDVIPVRRSIRTYKAPDQLCLNVEIDPGRLCFNIEVEEHSLGDLNEPANYKAALSDPKFQKWLVAMNAKMQSMYGNKVWRLVVLPPNEKVVKRNISPVAEIRAIRILIAIAAYYDYEIWQMDVKTMFLNGFLEEEIYIEQPKDFIDPNHPRKVYLGEAAFILGIKIYRDRSRRLIELSQNAYLDKILKIYRMDNSKRGSIPMQVDLHLSKSQCATTSAEMKCMHNVSYASANSGEAHWTAVKNILKYLRNTKDTFLVYGGDPEAELRVNCYCDVGFETDRDDTKSQTGKAPDKYHYVRECIETGEIDIVKVHINDNLADPFTKALAGPKLTRHARSMGLRPASSFM